jgi:hypothetical protein
MKAADSSGHRKTILHSGSQAHSLYFITFFFFCHTISIFEYADLLFKKLQWVN